MATKFRVVLRNIKAQNLLIKDTKTKSSDPYLKGNFDNFKTFQTEVVPKNLNPEFKFETTFFYETRFPNRLHEKMFKIEVFDKDKYSSDDFMGSIEIDLHTLATGPVRHDILIREFGKPAGRLSFDLEMDLWDDVVVTLKDINCDLTGIESWLSHDTIDPYMKVFFDFQPDNFVKTTSCKNTLKPCWSDTKQLVFKAPARQIVKGSITFTLLADKTMTKDPYLGEANLKIEPFINRTDELQKFKIELKKRDGSAWRQDQSYVEGFVFMKNLPWLAQMARGTHTEIGINDGEPLGPKFPTPKSYKPGTTSPTSGNTSNGVSNVAANTSSSPSQSTNPVSPMSNTTATTTVTNQPPYPSSGSTPPYGSSSAAANEYSTYGAQAQTMPTVALPAPVASNSHPSSVQSPPYPTVIHRPPSPSIPPYPTSVPTNIPPYPTNNAAPLPTVYPQTSPNLMPQAYPPPAVNPPSPYSSRPSSFIQPTYPPAGPSLNIPPMTMPTLQHPNAAGSASTSPYSSLNRPQANQPQYPSAAPIYPAYPPTQYDAAPSAPPAIPSGAPQYPAYNSSAPNYVAYPNQPGNSALMYPPQQNAPYPPVSQQTGGMPGNAYPPPAVYPPAQSQQGTWGRQ